MARNPIAARLPGGRRRPPLGRIAGSLPGVRPKSRLPIGGLAKRLPGGGRRRPSLGGLKNAPRNALLVAGGAAVGKQAWDLINQRRHATRSPGRGEAGGGRRPEAREEREEVEQRSGSEEQADADSQGRGLAGRLGGLFKRGGQAGGKKIKVTNIVEQIDIGAPRRLVYDQWTRFQDYPSFMKKVISVDQAEDGKLNWKAKIFWSSRTWESTIVEQVPDEHISWRSKGAKGHVDGTVSFHRLAPRLTRVLVVLEYHPQGFFERTGNLWRAQGRRVRLELKHFRRHVMTQSLHHPDEVEGWRGEIRDSEVVKTHEDAVAEEEKAAEQELQEAR